MDILEEEVVIMQDKENHKLIALIQYHINGNCCTGKILAVLPFELFENYPCHRDWDKAKARLQREEKYNKVIDLSFANI